MAKETHILVVDDEPKICEFLGILLGREGYQTDSAFNASDALARIERNSYDLVLTDLKMPGMDGFELITRLKKIRPDLPVIMVTGYATVETAVQALRYGVDDYVTKPFNIDELRKVIARSLQSATAQQQTQELTAQLQAAGEELARCRKIAEEQCISVIRMLVARVEAKDKFMIGHSRRVAEYACALAKAAGVSVDQIEILHKAADLHDVGQIVINDQIMEKPSTFTAEERGLVRDHPAMGERIIEPIESLGAARPLIRAHHERMDGGGYPDGLRGGNIPLLARMLSIADAFDGMTSERPYRPAMTKSRAAEELSSGAGLQFDPELAKVFCEKVVSQL
ncbi:MAG: HD domain-containing phosphohydrolase [Candidatus Brocadiia bacterium]|jgi:response regulator RpfG family c-di-GMP phosphodiesterase